MTGEKRSHPVVSGLLKDLGARPATVCEAPLTASELGELAVGRGSGAEARRMREHLKTCLACLTTFADVRTALTTPAATPKATSTSASPAVKRNVAELRRLVRESADAMRGAATELGPPREDDAAPGARISWAAESVSLTYAGPAQSAVPIGGARASTSRPIDILLGRVEALTEDARHRLEALSRVRRLLRHVRRVHRRIRTADLPAYVKAQLRTELGDAEERLLRAVRHAFGAPRRR